LAGIERDTVASMSWGSLALVWNTAHRVNLRLLLKRLGPGFVTGTSDDDPAAIGTYVQTGAQFGYGQLWTTLFTLPLMVAVQEMAGRIGLVTGQGLATVIRKTYAKPILYFIILIQVLTNTINIGADLSAMAESSQLLWHVPYWLILALATPAVVALIVFVPYHRYATFLKFLGLTLLSYVAAALTVHVDWHAALTHVILPGIEWNKGFVLTLIAVFGVTISPYEFFWQSNQEVEDLVDKGSITGNDTERPITSGEDIRFLGWDTRFGMFFSNAIGFFIIVTAAATLHAHGRTDVQSAAQAAQLLRPIAGPYAFVLFTLGIVGSGLLAIPVMAASSAYAVGGAFGWPRSLAKPLGAEWRFYAIIAISCFVGLGVNIVHIPPFKLLYYSAVLNGAISPFLLFMVTHIANSEHIMGQYRNRWWSTVVGYGLCGFMTLALIGFVVLSRGS
jgi:NRAMP (natural resistance-associated macrophage protein)-like metal ion transporter